MAAPTIEVLAMIRRVASALLVGGLLGTGAYGQTAPSSIAKPADTPPANPVPAAATSGAAASDATNGFRGSVPTDPAHPEYHAGAHRSIMRHNPMPVRTSQRTTDRSGGSSSSGQHTGGFSTGGVGRVAEYYDDRTLDAPIDHHPVPVASFDTGGGPNRNEQFQAQQAGQRRTANIQDNINAYGRPYGAMGAGLGFGFGLGSGLYGYPN